MEENTLDLSSFRREVTAATLSPDEWAQVDKILDEMLELPEHERMAYLQQERVENRVIRQQVQRLLAACKMETARAFLEPLHEAGSPNMLRQMEQALTTPQVEQLTPGQDVGPYTIVRPIGKGGMGVVYLAERSFDAYKKPVALKVVKRGMDTDDILHRFRVERQILAGLEHPHIARLLDGGVTRHGLPYFVMEYVDGEPIDSYCDNNKLPVRERLALLNQVCEAVQFAHQNLVVHRDLKPGNVLVTADGQVKLLDFGIAKLLDSSEKGATLYTTEDSGRRMTPEYAAPEQIRGDQITTATDVYALGVILYELLSGRRPYRFTTRMVSEFEEKICQVVPGRPSTASARNFSDTEKDTRQVSALRGTQPDRLRRQLAGDLDAIVLKALKKEPPLRYASAGELEADIERYLNHMPVQARRDSVRYRVGKFVRRYKLTVAASFIALLALLGGVVTTTWWAQKAQAALDAATEEKNRKEEINAYYTAMLSVFNPSTTEEYQLARNVLHGGIDKLEKLDDQPMMQAVVMNALGEFSRQFRLYGMADSLFQQSLNLQRKSNLPADHPDLITSLNGIGRVLMMQGRFDEAEAVFLENINNSPERVDSYINQSFVYLSTGRLDEAIDVLQQVIAIEPDNIKATNNLGISYFYARRWEEALAWNEKAVALAPSYITYLNLATLYYYQEARYADAAAVYEKALALNDKDYAIWGNLATAYYWAPNLRQRAAEVYDIAIAKAEKSLREFKADDAEAMSQLATYWIMLGDETKGRRYIEAALALAPTDNKFIMRHGFILERLGMRRDALTWIEKAITNGYPVNNIEGDPGFAELRSDVRYHNLQGVHPASDAIQ
ncbi:MAG: protein kinase [Bacteroidota bacterium]